LAEPNRMTEISDDAFLLIPRLKEAGHDAR